jgi:hypothetical protein
MGAVMPVNSLISSMLSMAKDEISLEKPRF